VKNRSSYQFAALSKDNWKDLVTLFGSNGACGGCWCMTPRLSSSQYHACKGERNKQLLHKLVVNNESLGVLAFQNGTPVAWCSISPKARLLEMKNSRTLKVTPGEHTWSIVCLFIRREYRRQGLSSLIIRKAADYAFANGAIRVEAYPVVPKNDKMPDAFAWMGTWKSYVAAGFSCFLFVAKRKINPIRFRCWLLNQHPIYP
jgi:GNAT superfamily N-acetyltransferase